MHQHQGKALLYLLAIISSQYLVALFPNPDSQGVSQTGGWREPGDAKKKLLSKLRDFPPGSQSSLGPAHNWGWCSVCVCVHGYVCSVVTHKEFAQAVGGAGSCITKLLATTFDATVQAHRKKAGTEKITSIEKIFVDSGCIVIMTSKTWLQRPDMYHCLFQYNQSFYSCYSFP